jgi:dihydrofolate reductase
MRRLRVFNHVTLDGVMQSPSGRDEDTRDGFEHGGWAAPYGDEVLMRRAAEGMARPGSMLLGRRTYEHFAGFWPRQTDGNPFTEHLNRVQKHVVSTTLSEPLSWQNSSVVGIDDVAALKERGTGDLVVLGSGELIQSLLRRDLVDELQLNVYPLVLGSGRRLFADGPLAFELVDSTPTTTGVVMATYRRKP